MVHKEVELQTRVPVLTKSFVHILIMSIIQHYNDLALELISFQHLKCLI